MPGPDPDQRLQEIARDAGLTLFIERPAVPPVPCLIAEPGDGDHRPGAWQSPSYWVTSMAGSRKAARDQTIALAEALEQAWLARRVNRITERGMPVPMPSQADGIWAFQIRLGFQIRH